VDQKVVVRFKKSLQAHHQKLQHNLSQRRREGRTHEPEHVKDEADRAAMSHTRELLFQQTSRDRSLLDEITAALARVAAGTFGECLNCGQEIGIKRLEAIPWVRYCIACQELIDTRE
jgi:DnaK suppressor protein